MTVAAAILALARGGEGDAAITWCERLHAEGTRRDAGTWQALLDCVRADTSLRHGDLSAAAEQAQTAFSRLTAASWGALIGYPLSVLLAANTALDNRRVTAEHLRQTVPEAMFETVWGLRCLRARGHCHLAVGHVLSTVGDFRERGDLSETTRGSTQARRQPPQQPADGARELAGEGRSVTAYGH
ncbi:hypothetical protein DVA86_26805 [Streptomyces armeniacus]|uniref:LuxR family transcriptional regulator n=1 Tax=Streptomyces armeniacus TaxID=83291 RepID=A0A345XVP1_9ACTN|nr:hypothetical protein [Streptomyces armeniacus]AXK35707.1 hypothetical protein DVA86_26805 [Streptomyces armeniacus]